MSEYQEQQELCDLKSKKQDFSDEKIDQILNDQLNSRIQSILKLPENQRQSQNFQRIYSSFYQNFQIENQNIKEIIQSQVLRKKVKQSYLSILQKNGFIVMNQDQKINKSSNKLQIKLVFQTQFNDVVQIFCQLGPFTKRYVILNENKQSFRHQNKVIGMGSFGKLYSCHQQSDENESVVKCIKYNPDEPLHLKNTIKEFFICDIMSSLKIGPKILKRSGFDFILFLNCIEFEMQRCVPCEFQTLEKDTKQNLFSMHILQIIHFDIKPANIMYSKDFQKNVLLDYGISQWINEPLGTKTLTKFRGTFEFCGQQMKKLFMKSQYEFIDLYLNDLNMLSKSIQYYKKHNANQNRSILHCKKVKTNYSQKSTIMFQQTLKLKYHLYINQFDQKITQEFQFFLNKLNKFQPFKDLQKIVKECLAYVQKLECNSLKNFLKYFVSKNPKLKHFQIDINSSLDSNFHYYRLKMNNLLKRQHQSNNKFIRLYQNLENNLQLKNTQTFQRHNSSQLQLKNIEYILLNKNELQKLQIEQKYELYLNYCQFWKCKFEVKSYEKQKVSQIFKDFAINRSKKFQQIYNMHKISDQNLWTRLVTIYSSILVYCRQGGFNDFKQKYMMSVIKDSIILGMQYHQFIRDYVTYYFKCLIKKRSKKLVTLIVVDFMQLIFLTQNHFHCTYQSNNTSYKDKYFFICSQQILEDLIKQFTNCQNNDQKQYYYNQKISVLSILWETLFNQELVKHQEHVNQQRFITNVIKIVQVIEKQFSDHKIKQITSLSSLSISYIHSTVKYTNQIYNLSLSFQSNLLKHYDNEIYKSWNFNLLQIKNLGDLNKIEILLDLFDNKIDFQELSQYFFVPRRFRIYKRYGTVQNIQHNFLNMILLNSTHPSINYEIILQFISGYFPFQIFDEKSMRVCLQDKLILHYCQLLIFFFNQGQSKKFIQCLHTIKGHQFRLSQYISEKSRQKLTFTLNHIIELDQRNQHHFLINVLLLEHQQDHQVQYLQLKKQIFLLFLQLIKKGRQIMPYQNYYFEELCLSNLILQDQILKLWSNIKLQLILGVDPVNTEYSQLLNMFFIETQNFSHFFEIFFILSRKKTLLTDTRAFIDIFDNFNKYLQCLQMNHSQFYQFYEKHCINEDKQTRIMLLLCVLKIKNFLKNNLQLWKKLLLKFYSDYSQLKKDKKIHPLIIVVMNRQLYNISYQYINTRDKNHRKILSICRSFFRAQFPWTFEYQQLYYQNFQNKIKEIIHFSSKYRSNNIFLKKIHKKLQNYKNLCPNNTNDNGDLIFCFRNARGYKLSKYDWYKNVNRNIQIMKSLNSRDYLLIKRKISEWQNINLLQKKLKQSQNNHFSLKDRQVQQFLIISDKRFRIWFRNSQEYQISEDIIDILNEILYLKKIKLLEEIKEKGLSHQLF